MRTRRIVASVSIIVSLLTGLWIYLSAREHDLVLHKIIRSIGLLNEGSHNGLTTQLPPWLLGSLPDGLWMFALCATILMAWNFKLHRRSAGWLGVAFVLGIGIELLQLLSIWPGAFDITDVVLMMVGASLAVGLFVKRS